MPIDWATLSVRCARLVAAAAACSTSAAFCCVMPSMWMTAWLTCPMPWFCSRVVEEISSITSVTRATEAITSAMVAPALLVSTLPAFTVAIEWSIRCLTSLAAVAERCARLRTSPATTAKPRPCSPARAASTAAFKARIFVWKAMPSIRPIMSRILRDEVLISSIVVTTSLTMVPPLAATVDACTARSLAVATWSALFCTVDVSSSMLAAVCSRLDACDSVRLDRSILPVAISAVVTRISSKLARTSPMMLCRLMLVWRKAAIN